MRGIEFVRGHMTYSLAAGLYLNLADDSHHGLIHLDRYEFALRYEYNCKYCLPKFAWECLFINIKLSVKIWYVMRFESDKGKYTCAICSWIFNMFHPHLEIRWISQFFIIISFLCLILWVIRTFQNLILHNFWFLLNINFIWIDH